MPGEAETEELTAKSPASSKGIQSHFIHRRLRVSTPIPNCITCDMPSASGMMVFHR